QNRIAAAKIAEGDVFELDVSLNGWQIDGIRLIGHVAFGVENLEDTGCRCARLRHQRNDEAKLSKREEHVEGIEAERLIVTDGERAADDLLPRKVKQRRLPH